MENNCGSFILKDGERLDEVNRNIKLIQNPRGLLYGTDAYMLASFMKSRPNDLACELGAGSGIISLLALSGGKIRNCMCVEIQEYFAELCRRNAELNGYLDRISVLCSDVRDVSKAEHAGRYGVVFTNPPYMQSGNGKRNETDEKYIARHEVFGGICDFIKCAAMLLAYGGYFYCVVRCDRLADVFCHMRESGIEPKRMLFVHATEKSEPSVALVEGIRGGKMSLTVERPIFLSDSCSGEMTERAKYVYDNLTFD